ncbi:MAG: chitobiase/beta-hexosaminidase C-terminal domain-containing protein, partial [Phycisphaeraceae bacterium]|nr:chitobiase/beta-hexosaminidase C-terminal domain-containing protein [Phycisphaeraceae bacterium]
SILCVLAACLLLHGGVGVGAEAKPPSAAAQVLARLSPLPDDVSRTIMNPYHAHPAWKLWAVDPSPVTISKPHFKGTFEPPLVMLRKYPILLRKGSTKLTLDPLGKNRFAGFWDDCYMSLDSHHTGLGAFKNQFIDGKSMKTARDVQTLLALGVNFTSQSYADRGRAIVDDILNNLNTERHFFFANCIRATPAHASYSDTNMEKVTDLYDGLFAHSYHSVGQSGSEMHAIYKMMAAGACMPRDTKNLLKKHGAYAIALLTIFKAALPYADAQGQPLPFEHELRHRSAYSSHGTPSHMHYCAANAHYHGYDESRHLQGMMDMARGLASAPPVAVARLVRFTAEKNGVTISDPARLARQVKNISLTNMRFWGDKDDTLSVRIDLNKSYDLQHKKLSFKCQTLYPNQKNVSITQEASGVFLIRVQHDPALPKGRIPIICTAHNGLAVSSNPVFINFYWPGENELDDYFAKGEVPKDVRLRIEAKGLKRLPVTVNLRPVVDFGFTGDAVRCRPGQTVSIDLKARDPEGFPVTVFRRFGEIGTVENGRFTATIPSRDQDKIYRVHFIFSDGTGGYTGKQIKLLVSRDNDTVSKDWTVTTLGPVQRAVTVNHSGRTFTFGKQPMDRQAKSMQGTLVCQPVSGVADLICRIPAVKSGTDLALMITNTLDGFSRHAGVGLLDGKISGVIKPREQTWGVSTYQWDKARSEKPEYFRLTRRDTSVVAYISKDNRTWEQVMAGSITFAKQCYAGLVYRGGPWTPGVCEWLSPSGSGSGLPVFSTGKQARDKAGQYGNPLEITVTSPDKSMTLRYTLDGSEPTAQSLAYEAPIKLTRPGRNEIRVKTFGAGPAPDTALAIYNVKRAASTP